MQHDTSIFRYQEMLRIRLVEERIADLYPEQEMRCPVHLAIGQEAVAVGVCCELRRSDWVFSGHRSHAHYLAKGGNLSRMMAEIYGKATGCSGGKGGSMHLTDLEAGFLGATPIVGSTIPIAVGAALSACARNEHRVVVVFFGDGATETGVYHESLSFAVLKKLPVVFVCENNFYSVYSPLAVRQPEGRRIASLAAAHGLWAETADGNDVEAVAKLAGLAVIHARGGKGPVLLEFSTYRWREHCGPNYDNDLGYRSEKEFEEWRARDPVATYGNLLQSRGIIDPSQISRMTDSICRQIDEAVDFAKTSPFPTSNKLCDEVHA